MSLTDSIGAIFDRLLMPRIAAIATFASFLFLLVTAGLIFLQLRTKFAEVPEITDRQLFTIITSNLNPTLATAGATFFIIFVTGLCSLLIEAVSFLKVSLLKAAERRVRDLNKLERSERLQRIRPAGNPRLTDMKYEDLKERLLFIRTIYPYFLIFFDLLFYICIVLAVPVLYIVFCLVLAILNLIPYALICMIIFLAVYWAGHAVIDLIKRLRGKMQSHLGA